MWRTRVSHSWKLQSGLSDRTNSARRILVRSNLISGRFSRWSPSSEGSGKRLLGFHLWGLRASQYISPRYRWARLGLFLHYALGSFSCLKTGSTSRRWVVRPHGQSWPSVVEAIALAATLSPQHRALFGEFLSVLATVHRFDRLRWPPKEQIIALAGWTQHLVERTRTGAC